MITSIEAGNMLFSFLGKSILMTDINKPSGELCKFERAEGSTKEDIVINTLGLNREPVQKGVLIVNIYVSNLDPAKIPNIGTGRNRPDTARLLYLSKLFQSVFNDNDETVSEVWINQDTCFEITSDDQFSDVNNQHYISFRINFFTIK
ncbi:hypothetical protein [Sphingobacterium yanglingense]|uniref:Uncharacterized protein n=1 Tax=Sphingobacterium yanglingense TaxID=1437280 RepID=A0A4R6WML3_9SPHI|nr:hypothetical protein [Sphingobacterium yanglingense]TDQ79585.1 hypothetical protein CLV99_1030 [Sphingobacterium yanglingense]